MPASGEGLLTASKHGRSHYMTGVIGEERRKGKGQGEERRREERRGRIMSQLPTPRMTALILFMRVVPSDLITSDLLTLSHSQLDLKVSLGGLFKP
jgi:hypothetical protein